MKDKEDHSYACSSCPQFSVLVQSDKEGVVFLPAHTTHFHTDFGHLESMTERVVSIPLLSFYSHLSLVFYFRERLAKLDLVDPVVSVDPVDPWDLPDLLDPLARLDVR